MLKWLIRLIPISWIWTTEWYRKSEVYKFKPGDILVLKSRYNAGYGVKPIIYILGYDEFGYEVIQDAIMDSDWHKYIIDDTIESKAYRCANSCSYLKSSLELHFRKVGPHEDPFQCS